MKTDITLLNENGKYSHKGLGNKRPGHNIYTHLLVQGSCYSKHSLLHNRTNSIRPREAETGVVPAVVTAAVPAVTAIGHVSSLQQDSDRGFPQ